jgi:prepilin-type N-terminal cleavage/methylation domain-containing protein
MTVKRAYTLIEILIVLALISLIMAIAIPSFGIFNTIKENQEFSELKRDLLMSRHKAIVENCPYEVKIDLDKNMYEIYKTNNTNLIKSKTFESGLKFIRTVDTTTNVVIFSPSGSPSRSGSFVLKKRNGDKYRFAIVVTSGKLNIYSIK